MKTTNLLPKVFGILMMAGSLTLVGCGESENAETATQVDTREVTKQPEPQAPSLEQKLETDSQAPEPQAPTPEPAAVEETQPTEAASEAVSGQSLYTTCIGCHGAAGEGGVGPKLAGQAAEDLVVKMKAYRAGEQVGPMTAMMAPMAASLSDDEIDALADYITSL